MNFLDLFNTFSRRSAPPDKQPKQLTSTFRNRVMMRCGDLLVRSGFQENFWNEIHSQFKYLFGAARLTTNPEVRTPTEDVLIFLPKCSDENFLDFIEYIFRTQVGYQVLPRDELISEINEFLRIEDLPYSLTGFVWVKKNEGLHGRLQAVTKLQECPRIIRKDSEVVHRTAIEPVLQLLRDAGYQAANSEFLEALEDYRKADYGDCLTKCGSALESVLKVVCDKKGWPYSATSTAAPLVKTVVEKSGLEGFFEQPLVLVATLRNRLSTAHGAGTAQRNVSQAIAEYSINATAAAILLVVK